MTSGTLVPLAPTGAEPAEADVPALPVSVAEVVAAVREATDLVALRVGTEDTLTYAPGEPVRNNAQLVARAAGLARIAQRPPLTPTEAREMLDIPPSAPEPVRPRPVEVPR